jgi:hypothetical protein
MMMRILISIMGIIIVACSITTSLLVTGFAIFLIKRFS